MATSKAYDYRELCERAIKVVNEAAAFIRERHLNRENLNIEVKGKHNFVTEVDKKAEEILVAGLSKVLPEAGFIAEEGSGSGRKEGWNWIIDPVDGTTNFIHGVYPFAISVGLTHGKEIIAGVVYEFGLAETFCAWKDGGAWCDGRPIRVSHAPRVEEALIATGFPYTNYKYMDGFMESINFFMKHSHGLRRLGSAATDIAYVACGRYDAFFEYGLNPWDIAAGLLLVKEAGGSSSDFLGDPDCLFGEHIVCTNGHIQDEFQETTRKIMLGE